MPNTDLKTVLLIVNAYSSNMKGKKTRIAMHSNGPQGTSSDEGDEDEEDQSEEDNFDGEDGDEPWEDDEYMTEGYAPP